MISFFPVCLLACFSKLPFIKSYSVHKRIFWLFWLQAFFLPLIYLLSIRNTLDHRSWPQRPKQLVDWGTSKYSYTKTQTPWSALWLSMALPSCLAQYPGILSCVLYPDFWAAVQTSLKKKKNSSLAVLGYFFLILRDHTGNLKQKH